jgi:alpha-ketoglutaric semialdehyde dehydrogenase
VFNVVTGEGSAAGGELCSNRAIMAMSFTGSYDVGRKIHRQLSERLVRTQLEMGAKNPTIVLADADLDLAVSLIVRAGFGLTGQACTATSRVIAERAIAAALADKLMVRAKSLRVANGMLPSTDMGPAVSKSQLESNLAYVALAQTEGAQLLCGGTRLTEGDNAHGHFMAPTLLAQVTPKMRIASEEVFGPVIALLSVDSFEEALTVANGTDTGLSATIVTRDMKKALTYAERIEAGVVKINQISTGLALQAPFGGVKHSSTDTFKEQGAGAVEFYSRLKTVYLDYSN